MRHHSVSHGVDECMAFSPATRRSVAVKIWDPRRGRGHEFRGFRGVHTRNERVHQYRHQDSLQQSFFAPAQPRG